MRSGRQRTRKMSRSILNEGHSPPFSRSIPTVLRPDQKQKGTAPVLCLLKIKELPAQFLDRGGCAINKRSGSSAAQTGRLINSNKIRSATRASIRRPRNLLLTTLDASSYRARASRPWRLCMALLIVSILTACSKTSTQADATRGQELYQFHCAPCHEMPPPDLLKEPPKLKGLFNSKTLPSGAPATDEQVRTVIVDGLRTMPAFQGRLQETEIRDLTAYLHKM
jgi:cytochrome c553